MIRAKIMPPASTEGLVTSVIATRDSPARIARMIRGPARSEILARTEEFVPTKARISAVNVNRDTKGRPVMKISGPVHLRIRAKTEAFAKIVLMESTLIVLASTGFPVILATSMSILVNWTTHAKMGENVKEMAPNTTAFVQKKN